MVVELFRQILHYWLQLLAKVQKELEKIWNRVKTTQQIQAERQRVSVHRKIVLLKKKGGAYSRASSSNSRRALVESF